MISPLKRDYLKSMVVVFCHDLECGEIQGCTLERAEDGMGIALSWQFMDAKTPPDDLEVEQMISPKKRDHLKAMVVVLCHDLEW